MSRLSRPTAVFPIVLRHVEVLETVDLTPSMQRIVVTGEELRAGHPTDGKPRRAFASDGFDDHVKLVFTGDRPCSWIGRQEAYGFDWNREALAASRDYTVRSYDAMSNQLVLDVVRHEHGIAADWFATCAPGDVLHLAGPKTSMSLSEGVDQWLLLGDETALPAIARFFDEIDADASVRAIIEVPTDDDRQPLRELLRAQVTWIARNGVPAGESDALMSALKQLERPSGRVYAWCAGEALTLAPLRRHLRTVWNLPKEDVEVVGYWRRPARPVAAAASGPAHDGASRGAAEEGTANQAAQSHEGAQDSRGPGRDAGTPAAEPPTEAPDARLQAMGALHEMTEIMPPVITRLAATFDIATIVAAGHDTVEAAAAASGLAPARLESLLDAMASIGLLTRADGRYAVTDTGALLAEEETRDELTLTDPANRLWLDLLGLDDVLRSGLPAERTLARRRRSDEGLDAALQAHAQELLVYLFDPLVQLLPLADARRVLVLGEAADYVSHELARRLGDADVVCGGALSADVVGDSTPDEPTLRPDVIVVVGAFTGLPEAQSAALATDLVTRAARHVVIVENLRDGAADDDHLAEADLQVLASTGVPLPSAHALETTLRAAGAQHAQTQHPGWGFGTYNAVVVADV